MRQSIKITIPKYSVTEFLMKCTDMDVKEKIEETFEAYAKGNTTFKNVDLSFNVLNSDEQNEKAPSFVRPSIDLKDPTVVKCVTEYDERQDVVKKVSKMPQGRGDKRNLQNTVFPLLCVPFLRLL